METKSLLQIIIFLFFLIGILLIYKSIKGWDENYKPKKISARLLRNLLGYEGTRFLVGFFGIVMILVFGYLSFMIIFGGSSNKKYKSDRFYFYCVEGKASHTLDNIHILNDRYLGPCVKQEITKISFKDNYMKKIPFEVWQLENLKVLDLENNSITDININDILKLKNLDTLIIKNTPISEENINQIELQTNIFIVK